MRPAMRNLQWSLLKTREIWFFAIGAVLGATACWFVATEVADWPPYQARSTLLIDKTPDAEQVGVSAEGIQIAQETVAALIVREPLSSDVAASVGRGFDGESVVERLRVERPEGAPIVEVIATHPDPETAALIANTTAERAAELDNPLTGVSVLSKAAVPTRPVFSSYLLVAVAGILGGLVTAGAAVLTRRLPRRIQAAGDIEVPTDYALIGEVDLSLPAGELTARNGFVLAKVMTAVDTAQPNLLFTSPRAISLQRQYLELQSEFLQHKLEDAFGPGPIVRLVAMDEPVDHSPRKGQHDFDAGADLVPLFTDLFENWDEPLVDEDERMATVGGRPHSRTKHAASNGSGPTPAGGGDDTVSFDGADRTPEAAHDAPPDGPGFSIQPIASADATPELTKRESAVDAVDATRERPDPTLLLDLAKARAERPDPTSPTPPVMVERGSPPEEADDGSELHLADWLTKLHLGKDGPTQGLAAEPGQVVSLVEAPPVLEEPNLVIQLSKYARVILLLERGTTRVHDAAEARQVLSDAGIDIAGTVLVG